MSVVSGCVWHERCDDETCDGCAALDQDYDFWLESSGPREVITVEFYEDTEGDVLWREVPDAG